MSVSIEASARQERVSDRLIWQMSREIVVSTVNWDLDCTVRCLKRDLRA